MASDISCPNCHQGFGKDKENPRGMHCDNCGEEFTNQYGYTEKDVEHWQEQEKQSQNGRA